MQIKIRKQKLLERSTFNPFTRIIKIRKLLLISCVKRININMLLSLTINHSEFLIILFMAIF
jgi:hypothetical protein